METIYRWTKSVPEDRLEEWETALLLDGVAFISEKRVDRLRWTLSAYLTALEEAETLRARHGGRVESIAPDAWHPAPTTTAGQPLRIRDRLLVTDSEDPGIVAEMARAHPRRVVLSFPPQLAFGTGSHATTAACLRFLVDFAKRRAGAPWRMLDLGCGSGILAVAAARLGAEAVVAVENDAMALGYARENGKRHGVGDRIEFLEADAVALMADPALARCDLIAANLFSDLLEELFPLFPAKLGRGGELIVSGFLATQAEGVASAAAEAGLPLVERSRRGKWMAGRALA